MPTSINNDKFFENFVSEMIVMRTIITQADIAK
jgi:hypothetical protein